MPLSNTYLSNGLRDSIDVDDDDDDTCDVDDVDDATDASTVYLSRIR